MLLELVHSSSTTTTTSTVHLQVHVAFYSCRSLTEEQTSSQTFWAPHQSHSPCGHGSFLHA